MLTFIVSLSYVSCMPPSLMLYFRLICCSLCKPPTSFNKRYTYNLHVDRNSELGFGCNVNLCFLEFLGNLQETYAEMNMNDQIP
jgi:hypothetical protein